VDEITSDTCHDSWSSFPGIPDSLEEHSPPCSGKYHCHRVPQAGCPDMSSFPFMHWFNQTRNFAPAQRTRSGRDLQLFCSSGIGRDGDDSLGNSHCLTLPRYREKSGNGKWWMQLPSFPGREDIDLHFQSEIWLRNSELMKSTTPSCNVEALHAPDSIPYPPHTEAGEKTAAKDTPWFLQYPVFVPPMVRSPHESLFFVFLGHPMSKSITTNDFFDSMEITD